MGKRIVTGTVITVVALGILVASVFVPAIFSVALFLLSLLGVYECLKVIGLEKNPAVCVGCGLYTAAVALLAFFDRSDRMAIAAVVLVVYLAALSVLGRDGKRPPISKLALAGFFTGYVTTGFGMLGMLFRSRESALQGILLVAVALLGAWMCDVGGWLFGVTMGRHKLCPSISPKKSVEGLLGSVLFSCITLIGIALLSQVIVPETPLKLWLLAAVSPFFALVELVGDLVASVLKREFGVKDFGTIFPGHGGIMDRFDGVLMTSILTWFIARFVGLY